MYILYVPIYLFSSHLNIFLLERHGKNHGISSNVFEGWDFYPLQRKKNLWGLPSKMQRTSKKRSKIEAYFLHKIIFMFPKIISFYLGRGFALTFYQWIYSNRTTRYRCFGVGGSPYINVFTSVSYVDIQDLLI